MQNLDWLGIVIKFALYGFWASSTLYFKACILILYQFKWASQSNKFFLYILSTYVSASGHIQTSSFFPPQTKS